MPVFDFICEKCECEFDALVMSNVEKTMCKCCGKEAKRVFPRKAPGIELKYNPQTDMVDWDGNRSKYWDEYKKQKEEGKKVRIPKHDGDG